MLLIYASILFLISCGKKDNVTPDDNTVTGKSSYKITYKIILPSKFTGQATFTSVANSASSAVNLTGTWTSQEYTFKPGTAVAITASASASDNSTGEMTIQILEDSKVIKEVKASGQILSATTSISLE